ncbi:leptin receptor gene-related protein [Aphidius gifuensis]|nr:leptin receptor gene-related protein [Aphidius gifuensis]XP_044007952.1 leptin receptor gene-related protein [Aphidius gifuensis]
MTFVILGCALSAYQVWWPILVVVFYLLAPLPTMIARRYNDDSGSNSNPCLELAIFITMGIVISSFAFPIVLARSPPENGTIAWGACFLTLIGNSVVYLTLVGFFMTIDHDDADYSMW